MREDEKEKIWSFNSLDLEDEFQINDLLNYVQIGKVSCRKGTRYIFDAADRYWADGLRTGRGDRRDNLLSLREIRLSKEYKEFITKVSNESNDENLKLEALEIIGRR